MKSIKREDGFTIIEILAGINIAFIILTIAVSFYLIVLKFTFGTLKKADEKNELTDCIYRIGEMFNKKEDFQIRKVDGTLVQMIFNKTDTVVFSSHSIRIKNLQAVTDIEKNEVLLTTRDNGELVLFSGPNGKEFYTSAEISAIKCKIVKNKYDYRLEYLFPEVSTKYFQDIDDLEK